MNYILKKVEVNMNADQFGGRDTEIEIGISNDVKILKDYCKREFDCEASEGKPEKFAWEYYTIIPTTLKIL